MDLQNRRIGRRGLTDQVEIFAADQTEGVFRAGFQTGDLGAVTGELGFRLLAAGGSVAQGPCGGLGAAVAEDQIELDCAGLGPVGGGEGQDLGLRDRGGDHAGLAGDLVPSGQNGADRILGAGRQAGQGSRPVFKGDAGRVAVGILTDCLELLLLDARLEMDLKGIRRHVGDRKRFDLDEIVPEPLTEFGELIQAHQNDQQDHGGGEEAPGSALASAALGGLFGCAAALGGQHGRIVHQGGLGLGGRLGLFLLFPAALAVRREGNLELIVKLLDVVGADGLDLLLAVGRVQRAVVRDQGRNDQMVADRVAAHILLQRHAHLVRGLVAVLGLVGAGLLDDLRQLVVGIEGRGQGVALESAGIGGLGVGLLVLKGGVVAVVDPVEDHAQRVDVHRGIQTADEVAELRGGIAAAVLLGQDGILHIVRGDQAEIAQQEAARIREIDVAGLEVSVNEAFLAQGGQGHAEVDAHIDAAQMGDGVLLQIVLQGVPLGQDGIDLIAHALLLRLHLNAQEGQDIGAVQ